MNVYGHSFLSQMSSFVAYLLSISLYVLVISTGCQRQSPTDTIDNAETEDVITPEPIPTDPICINSLPNQPGQSNCSYAQPPVAKTQWQTQLSSIEVTGTTFDILSNGPQNGKAVLLLQGFPHASYDHRLALSSLANAGYRAISMISRDSELKLESVHHYAQLALDIADALKLERFHIAGGALAGEVATMQPDRVISIAAVTPLRMKAISELEQRILACEDKTLTKEKCPPPLR